jgi:hypothetical protein
MCHAMLAELPGRKRSPLVPRPGLVHPDMDRHAVIGAYRGEAAAGKKCPIFPLSVSSAMSLPISHYATAICKVVGPSPSSVVRRMSRTSLVSL